MLQMYTQVSMHTQIFTQVHIQVRMHSLHSSAVLLLCYTGHNIYEASVGFVGLCVCLCMTAYVYCRYSDLLCMVVLCEC